VCQLANVALLARERALNCAEWRLNLNAAFAG
jgi:hypothetical protein